METHYDVYARQLSYLDEGFALFEPDPIGQYDAVQVGDIGYISRGKFMKLWNVFCSGPNHALCIDQAICNLPVIDTCPHVPRKFCGTDGLVDLMPGEMCSRSFTRKGGDLRATFSGQGVPILAGTHISYSCDKRLGASLITKYRAPCKRAIATGYLKQYVLQNCKAFWIFAVQEMGRDIEMHDMVFVTGRRLTGDWATAVVNDFNSSIDIGFTFSTPTVLPVAASLGVSVWGDWSRSTTTPVRRGPLRGGIIPEDEEPEALDQCIFVQGLRVVDRAWYERLKVAVRALFGDSLESQSYINIRRRSSQSAVKDFKIEDLTKTRAGDLHQQARNVYEVVAIYIFENSEATLAMIEDYDVQVFSEEDTLAQIMERLTHGPFPVSLVEVAPGLSCGKLLHGIRSAFPGITDTPDWMLVNETFGEASFTEHFPLAEHLPLDRNASLEYDSNINDEGNLTEIIKPLPMGACMRCKSLKVRCEYPVTGDTSSCKRCLKGGHECRIEGRKSRRHPPKREHLLINEIRSQAMQIKELMEKLGTANEKYQAESNERLYVSSNEASPASQSESMSYSLLPDLRSNSASGSPIDHSDRYSVSGSTAVESDHGAVPKSIHISGTETPPSDVQAWIANAKESIVAVEDWAETFMPDVEYFPDIMEVDEDLQVESELLSEDAKLKRMQGFHDDNSAATKSITTPVVVSDARGDNIYDIAVDWDVFE